MGKIFFAKSAYDSIMSDETAKKQVSLYVNFVNNKLSLKNYLGEQKKIDQSQLDGAKKIRWNDLLKKKPETHRHEKEHYKVYLKYGIESKLYCKDSFFFVIDTNLSKVVKEKNYDKKKVISILKEMLIAPYDTDPRKNDQLEHYKFDIPCYEALTGNIKQLSLSQFESALSQYQISEPYWIRTR